MNYHLVDPGGKSYKQRYSELVKNAGCKVRSNSVVMVETLITASPEFLNGLSGSEQKQFFEKGLEFISSKVGEQNIISAVVHMDETTPHMHLCFCPITPDGRLSAHSVLGDGKCYSKWQVQFYEYMSKDYPELSRGIPSSITHREHLPMYLFRQATELDQAYPKIVEALKDINPFNSGKKRGEALNLLSKYTGKMKRFSLHMQDAEDQIRELETVRNNLQEQNSVQGEEISNLEATLSNLEIDLTVREVQIRQLLNQMWRMQDLLDRIPKDYLEDYEDKRQEYTR